MTTLDNELFDDVDAALTVCAPVALPPEGTRPDRAHACRLLARRQSRARASRAGVRVCFYHTSVEGPADPAQNACADDYFRRHTRVSHCSHPSANNLF